MQTKPKSVKNSSSEPSVVKAGSNPKGVIYIDQDSDITSIASKIRLETAKDIKIVVPKNSAALKSGVNLKLLARTAHNKAKSVVLITSDSKLISMASTAKLSTAPNLSAEPTLATPSLKVNHLDSDEEFDDLGEQAKNTKSQNLDEEDLTIDGAELAAATAGSKGKQAKKGDSDDLDDKPKQSKKDKKAGLGKRIPNFYDFRKKALIGLGIFFIIFIGIFFVLGSKSKAVVEVRANAERVDVNFVAKLNESATESTEGELKVDRKSGSKAITDSVPATGEQNIGAKATGNMTFSIPCSAVSGDPPRIPAGTGVSSNGLTYVTQGAANLTTPTFNGGCKFTGGTTVTAQQPGDNYNVGARTYTVAGYSSVTGTGSAMTGGTTQNVKVISNADVDTLKAKLATSNEAAYKAELIDQVSDEQKALEDTFGVQLSNVQLSPAVGQQAEQLSGTVTANYSMLAVNQSELKKLLTLQVEKLKKSQNQSIIKDGFDSLKLSIAEDSGYQFATTAYLGPNIDQEKIKDEVASKKKGEAIAAVNKFEGVDSTKVKINPFWVSKLPGRAKIEVKIVVNESSN